MLPGGPPLEMHPPNRITLEDQSATPVQLNRDIVELPAVGVQDSGVVQIVPADGRIVEFHRKRVVVLLRGLFDDLDRPTHFHDLDGVFRRFGWERGIKIVEEVRDG